MTARLEGPASDVITVGTLHVDLAAYRAVFEGRVLTLSRSQIEVLGMLMRNAHRVVSRGELSEALGVVRGRSVDVMLTMLRRELGVDFVRNVRGRGWILVPAAVGA